MFTQYDMGVDADGKTTLAPLPASNIDTGLGLERMAVIQQGVDTVFEIDTFAPLMALGRELADVEPDERALRILSDHSRAMTFLIADGVVPSNEARGYILRRIMRRAIQQGRPGRASSPGLSCRRFAEAGHRGHGRRVPRAGAPAPTRSCCGRARRRRASGRTLEQGTRLLGEVIERSRESRRARGAGRLPASTTRSASRSTSRREHRRRAGCWSVDTAGVRRRSWTRSASARAEARSPTLPSRAPARTARASGRPATCASARASSPARTATSRTPRATRRSSSTRRSACCTTAGNRILVRRRSPKFYATGGGGADCGVLDPRPARRGHASPTSFASATTRPSSCRSTRAPWRAGARARRSLRARQRRPTSTATHLLHAALRETLGTHVRQAGSYVGTDKLRFDFSHGERISPEDLATIEDRVNEWVLRNDPVRPITTTLDEARALGAMALFGEKYGDIVRMVQIGDRRRRRELCGGTHVRSTAEIGVFKLVSEEPSVANVRRIEAITGSEAVAALRGSDAKAHAAATLLKTGVAELPEAVAALSARVKQAAKAASSNGVATIDADALAAAATQIAGADVVASVVSGIAARRTCRTSPIASRASSQTSPPPCSARSSTAACTSSPPTPALVARGVKAGEIVKAAAQVAGGGGGGRDTMAQAGGKDPEALPAAIAAARDAIAAALAR